MTVERAYLDPKSQQPINTFKLGEQVLVRITVSSPIARAHVAVAWLRRKRA